MRAATILLMAAALAAPAAGLCGDKGGKPKLNLKASPRFAFSPVSVMLTASLEGGKELEDFHCPELEWDWDDGGKSVHEADCDPLEPGADIQRRFTATHQYRQAGVYNVTLTMRNGDRSVAQRSVKVTVRSGLGDPTIDRE